jgi:hypothetical protein
MSGLRGNPPVIGGRRLRKTFWGRTTSPAPGTLGQPILPRSQRFKNREGVSRVLIGKSMRMTGAT